MAIWANDRQRNY